MYIWYISQLYPFLCRWTFRLLPCCDYRRHTVEKQTHEKMFSITNREMQIKITVRYHLAPVRMAIIKKSKKNCTKNLKKINNKFWRGCEEKGLLLYCWWECKLIQSLWRTEWMFLKKLKIELPCDPAIPLLGIYPEKIIIQKDTCTPMFIATLFIIARTRQQQNLNVFLFPAPNCSWITSYVFVLSSVGLYASWEFLVFSTMLNIKLDTKQVLTTGPLYIYIHTHVYIDMEKEMATHFSILAWKIPWTEEPGGPQSRGCKELADWATEHTYTHTHIHIHTCILLNSVKTTPIHWSTDNISFNNHIYIITEYCWDLIFLEN